jgi:hypothetical protein
LAGEIIPDSRATSPGIRSIGEAAEDLQRFEARAYARSLVGLDG